MLKILFVLFLCHCVSARIYSNDTDRREILKETDWTVWCKFQSNSYNCLGKGTNRWIFFYDTKLQDCTPATVGQCPYNQNLFYTLPDCKRTCRGDGEIPIRQNLTARVYCRLQPDFGYCDEYYPMFYFDMTLRRCRGFSFSGCGGNANRFDNKQTCQSICGAAVKYLS